MDIKEFHTVFPELLSVFSNKDLLHYTDLDYCDSVNDMYLQSWVADTERVSLAGYENGSFVGFVSAHLVEKHVTASVTVVVLQEYQQKGYAETMMTALLDMLASKGYIRVEAQICTENKPSLRLFDRMGFSCEGRLRRNFLIDGLLKDSFMYAKFTDANGNKSEKLF